MSLPSKTSTNSSDRVLPTCPGEATQLSLVFLNFLSVARHCIVTSNAGARITYLLQYLVNQSREPGLERIRTLTLPLGQDLPCEVVDVGEK